MFLYIRLLKYIYHIMLKDVDDAKIYNFKLQMHSLFFI